MTNREWFKGAKFGMFIHWGLYSVLGGEWRHGVATQYLGEWIMNRLQIPIKEYEQLTAAFNPIFFDAEEWVKLAKDAGIEYIVITSKHHDGFALFKSEVDPYNVVDATPFGRDIIAEMAAACQKHGVQDLLLTTWGDDGAECARYALLPSFYYFAEYAKGNTDEEGIKAGFKRMFGAEFDDFLSLDDLNEILVGLNARTSAARETVFPLSRSSEDAVCAISGSNVF